MIEHLFDIVTAKTEIEEALIHQKRETFMCYRNPLRVTFFLALVSALYSDRILSSEYCVGSVHFVSWFIQFSGAALSILNTGLTLHESDDSTEKSEHPKRWSEDRNKVKNGTKEPTDEQRILPAKLVRYGTHANATDKKSQEDN